MLDRDIADAGGRARLRLSIDRVQVRGYRVAEPSTLTATVEQRLTELVDRHGLPTVPALPDRRPVESGRTPVDDADLAAQIADAVWARIGGRS